MTQYHLRKQKTQRDNDAIRCPAGFKLMKIIS